MSEKRPGTSCDEDAHAILTRMMADAERLCAVPDALLDGQAAQLRGRIAAMLVVTEPPVPTPPEVRA